MLLRQLLALALLTCAPAVEEKPDMPELQEDLDRLVKESREKNERANDGVGPPIEAGAMDEQTGTKVVTLDYAKDWQDQVLDLARKTARELSGARQLLADELDTLIADINGKQVAPNEYPAPARFPVRVKFTPWTDLRFAQVRKFELSYEQWEGKLAQAEKAFMDQHNASREQYAVSVFDRQGMRLEAKERPAKNRFPIMVKLIPTGPSKKHTAEIPYSPAGQWRELISKEMENFAEGMKAEWAQIGTSVTDNTGASVGSKDFPDKSLFPLKVNLIYVGTGAASAGKSFSMDYEDNWKEHMNKLMAEFTALHGLRPERFSMVVVSRTGEVLEQDAGEEQFPIVIKFELRDSSKRGEKRKRRRRSKSKEL